jgi:hypothetical protein
MALGLPSMSTKTNAGATVTLKHPARERLTSRFEIQTTPQTSLLTFVVASCGMARRALYLIGFRGC